MNDMYVCPFCNGCKTKPFVRAGSSQDCKDCNANGMIKGSVIRAMGIEDFVKDYVKPQPKVKLVVKKEINTKDMVDVITGVLEQYGLMHDLNLFQTEGLCLTLQARIDKFIKESK